MSQSPPPLLFASGPLFPALGPRLSATVVVYVVRSIVRKPFGLWDDSEQACLDLACSTTAGAPHSRVPEEPQGCPVPRIQPEAKVLESFYPDWSRVRSTMLFNCFMEGRSGRLMEPWGRMGEQGVEDPGPRDFRRWVFSADRHLNAGPIPR